MTNIGEEKAYAYLCEQGYEVEDTTENPEYFEQDIDFIARTENEEIKCEVKWDNRIHNTGNMFIETLSNVDRGKDGWFQKCAADQLFYGDSFNNIFYIIEMKHLREYLDSAITDSAYAADYCFNGKVRKQSKGELVPIADFRMKYPVQIVSV